MPVVVSVRIRGRSAQGPESVVGQQDVAGEVRRAQRGRDVPVVSCVCGREKVGSAPVCVCCGWLSLARSHKR